MTAEYFYKNLLNLTIICLFLACAGRVDSQEPDLEMLLDQMIVAYGGEENLRRLNNHIQEWSVVALMGNRHGTDTRRIRVPDQLKVEVTYPHKKETRVVNGESGYVLFQRAPARTTTQPQKDAMRLQLMRHYSPLVLRDKIDSLTTSMQGEFRIITLVDQRVSVDYYVRIDNKRIEKVVGSLAVNGSAMQFLTEYSDFVFQDGVLVHSKENKFAGGVNTAILQLRRITFDADLTEADFLPDSDKLDSPVQQKNDII